MGKNKNVTTLSNLSVNLKKKKLVTLDETGWVDGIGVYCSPTRFTGSCCLLFIIKENNKYLVHFMNLFFNYLGVKEYFHWDRIKASELLEIINEKGLVEISPKEGQSLVLDAYEQNNRYNGKADNELIDFIQLISQMVKKNESNFSHKKLLRQLEGNVLSVKELVNAVIFALKNIDGALIYDLATRELKNRLGSREEFVAKWAHPLEQYSFIKTTIRTCLIDQKDSNCQVMLIASDDEDKLKKIEIAIDFIKGQGGYWLADLRIDSIVDLKSQDPLNPLNHQVYTAVYKGENFERLRDHLDTHYALYMSGEFDNGVCYKWFQSCDPLVGGIDISKNIYGEFILTPDELIVFSGSLKNLTEIMGFIRTGVKGEQLQLKIKTRATIKEIYQVITDKIKLAEELAGKAYTYLIPPENLSKWKTFWMSHDHSSFANGDEQVIHLDMGSGKIEILLYERYGILNLFDYSLEHFLEDSGFSDLKAMSINKLAENDFEISWSFFKVIKELKKDPSIKAYFPLTSDSMKVIADKFQLVIS